jgi:hypothetical protein
MTEPHFFVAHPSVQFKRAQRYVKRLRDGYEGRELSRHAENMEWEDDMYSAFIHIHHIRDWFADKALLDEAAKFANNDVALQRCAWIANLWKHSKKDRKVPAHVGRLPTLLTITVATDPMMDRPPTQSYPFVFKFSDGSTEVFESLELAERGLRSWETFIAQALADGRLAEFG